MKELERLIKIRKCHFDLQYSSICDWHLYLWLKGYNDDGSDLIIFDEWNNDLDYLIDKCKVTYKDWLLEHHGGY